MLYELIYSSTAVKSMENKMLEGLLSQARHNNTISSVTGILTYDGESFCQLIEGPKDAIERTFARIKADSRHTDVSILHSGVIEARSFGEWAMSFNWAENHFGKDGWKTWLEGQLIINASSATDSTGRKILKFINNIS